MKKFMLLALVALALGGCVIEPWPGWYHHHYHD
jgi:hypothetical protein